jgi:hypothetical protein
MPTKSPRSRSRTRLFELCCALLIPSVSLAQPDRATATQILIAALRAVRMDSVCHVCRVVVVDTAIQGGAAPVIDWAYPRALRALDTPTHRYVAGTHPYGYQPRDTAFIWTRFMPAALTMSDSGQVIVDIDTPGTYGWEVIVQVKRCQGKWHVLRTYYEEG